MRRTFFDIPLAPFVVSVLLALQLPKTVIAGVRQPYTSPPSEPQAGLVVTSWEGMRQVDWACQRENGERYDDHPYPRDRYMIRWSDFAAKLHGDNSKTAWKVGESHFFRTAIAKTALMYTLQ